MSNRRSFLKHTTIAATATLFSKPISSLAAVSKNAATLQASGKSVIIYYSGQLNGKVNNSVQNIGGIQDLARLIDKQDTGGLILDAGNFLNQDISQHAAVIEAMNAAGYHTSTLAAQDLSYGQAHLANLAAAMNFCLVNCNYIFDEPQLAAVVKPWQVINFGRFRIGITGVGPKIKGIGYMDPVKKANETAEHLKNNFDCDFVICLSGLEYYQKDHTADNILLAEQSKVIDFIISSRTQHAKPFTKSVKNKTGHDVMIGHTLANGAAMGKMVFEFRDKQTCHIAARHISIQAGERNNSQV